MNKIRIYFIPKGFKDIICNSVIIDSENKTAKIIDGKEHNTVYQNCRGAKVIKFDVEEQE